MDNISDVPTVELEDWKAGLTNKTKPALERLAELACAFFVKLIEAELAGRRGKGKGK